MTNNRIWPEGETFTKTVMLPTRDDVIEVDVLFVVPAFSTVIDMFGNKDPEKAYPLFRQFLVDWDLEDKLTDNILMGFMVQNIEVSKVIFAAWCEQMEEHLLSHKLHVMPTSASLN